MILTCPNCSTRYRVEAESVGAEGRKVRCAKCGHTWVQMPEAPENPPPPADQVDTPAGEPPAEEAPPIPEPPTDLREARERLRRESPMAEPDRRAWPRVFAWLFFVVIVAAIVAGAYRYRQQFVAYWPPVARLYETLGIPVQLPPGYGLVLSIDHTGRETRLGDPVLVLEGTITNESGRTRPVPRIHVILRNVDKQPVQDWTFRPSATTLEPGESVKFTTSVRKPDPAAADVTFEYEPAE